MTNEVRDLFSLPAEERKKYKLKRVPRRRQGQSLTTTELQALDFNLANRGLIKGWILKSQQEHGFQMEEILTDTQAQLIEGYFLTNEWESQEDVSLQIWGDPATRNFKTAAQKALFRISRRIQAGDRAIEILKITGNVYSACVRGQITTIDQICDLSPDQLVVLTGARPQFEELVERMREYFPTWDPKVEFLQELPPDEAFKRSRIFQD